MELSMKRGIQPGALFKTIIGIAATCVAGRVRAGSYSADFSGIPSPPLSIWSSSAQSGQRSTTGGNTGGHFVLTPASANERCVVKLPDLDPGKLVSAFDFSVDCRIGGGTAYPADGMSVNFVSVNDPVVLNGNGFLGPPAGGSDAPEEGTATGLSVCMDAWDNGGTDWVGFTVKKNGVVIAQTGADIRHGLLTETGSLQTGPLNRSGGDTTSLLGWARLRIVLYHTGRLDVFWKNLKVINLVQTYWVPMSGHFVIGARTGSSSQLHDLDNLTVLTTASATAMAEVTPRPARVQFALAAESLNSPVGAAPVRGSLAVTVPADASAPLGNAAQVAGKIALVDRSDTVPFSDQIRRCQNAGAIGVMVINNVAAPSIRMTGRGFPEFTIPAVMISGLTGLFIRLDPAPFVAELGRDRTGILGEFDGGRGPGTTDFTFFVPAAGAYPVRLTYEQGGGGGALEFFHYDAATGGGPTLFGAPYSGGPGIPMLYQNRLEPVAPTRVEHLAATRQFRVWLPLTPADILHVDSAAELYSETGATWQTLYEQIPAPAAGQPWSYTRPIPSHPLSARQFFRFDVLRGLE
jgi:hypothetical protein